MTELRFEACDQCELAIVERLRVDQSPVTLVELECHSRGYELIDSVPSEVPQLRVIGETDHEAVKRVVELFYELWCAPRGRKLRRDVGRQRELYLDDVSELLPRPLRALRAPQLLAARQLAALGTA